MNEQDLNIYKLIKTDYSDLVFVPLHSVFEVEESDYENIYKERYFCCKVNDPLSSIIEINEDQYSDIVDRSEDELTKYLYKVVMIYWKIYGPKEDIVSKNGIIQEESCKTYNRNQLLYAEQFMPGITNAVKNLEFKCRFYDQNTQS